MSRYLLVRLIRGIVALFLTSIIVFGVVRLTGNPLDVILPEGTTQETYDAMAKLLGLDRPLYEQYWVFLTNLVKGDWGRSIFYQREVVELVMVAVPRTLQLAAGAALVSFLFSIPAGVLAAVKRDRWQDIIAKGFAIVGQSMPGFWLGILLIQFFAVELGWFPAGGYGGGEISYWILPAVTIGYHSTAGLLRLTRSAMLDILSSDFVRLAKIKGVPARLVIWKHALRNALIPVVTFAGVIYVGFLMGSVITETIFAWPGIGRLAYQAIKNRDFPLIQGVIIIFVAIYVVFDLAVDILYCYLDPRIRVESK